MEKISDWRTSSRTSHQGQCVEVGFGADEVGVRDTKNRPAGYFTVDLARWEEFLCSVKRGEFDF